MSKKDSKTWTHQPNRQVLIAGVAVGMVLLLLVSRLAIPSRSVTTYCQAYKTEKARLAALPGNTWSSSVFNDAVSDAGEMATAFSRLEKVAPDEIRSDVATLQSLYQKVKDDPSQAFNAGLSSVRAEDNVKKWTQRNCNSDQRSQL